MGIENSVTRRELAATLRVDPRTIAKWLECGLPVVSFGRGGRPSLYDPIRAVAWVKAYRCTRAGGRPCWECRIVLEDAQAVMEHLRAVRHDYGGCEACAPPPRLCQPCA